MEFSSIELYNGCSMISALEEFLDNLSLMV